MWEPLWEGHFSAYISGVLSTSFSDLTAPSILILELQRAKVSGL